MNGNIYEIQTHTGTWSWTTNF